MNRSVSYSEIALKFKFKNILLVSLVLYTKKVDPKRCQNQKFNQKFTLTGSESQAFDSILSEMFWFFTHSFRFFKIQVIVKIDMISMILKSIISIECFGLFPHFINVWQINSSIFNDNLKSLSKMIKFLNWILFQKKPYIKSLMRLMLKKESIVWI
jgi:hypothetical protein